MAESTPKAAAKKPAASKAEKAPAAEKAPKAEPKKAAAPKTAAPAQAASASTDDRADRRTIIGKVVNDTASPGRAKKTLVIEVVRRVRDPVYGKYVKRAKRFHAHDEKEQYKTNDLVEIRESRPLSATKRWMAIRLVERPEEV